MRFYGEVEGGWFNAPYDFAMACVEAMVPIQAQESLTLATASMVGAGNMKKEDARRVVESWKRQASAAMGPPARQAQKPKDRKEWLAFLKKSRIGYKEVPRARR